MAEIAHAQGAVTIACLTLPFEIESLRRQNAIDAIRSLESTCNSVVLIDNTKLRKFAGKLPLKTAFAVANSLIGALVKSTPAISSPYGLLINIIGVRDMTLDEMAKIGELMSQRVPDTKRVIWGARVNDAMTGRIQIIALFSSVGNPFEQS